MKVQEFRVLWIACAFFALLVLLLTTPGFKPAAQTKEVYFAVQEDKIDINSAPLAELQCLPGIGQVKAQNIILYRETQGVFSSLEQLKEVPGISEEIYLNVLPLIMLGADTWA